MSDDKVVLLVEDNADNRAVYVMMLEHHGYSVIEATNGEDGVRLAKEKEPDIILIDISIPKLDGWSATELIKDDPVSEDIPIVVVTAHALPEHRQRAEELGCAGFLVKPCKPQRLLEEVQKHIG